MRSRVGKSECSESEAFVGTRGRRADGETFDSEREGGFRGRLQGGASGGKPQVSHNRPLACPARRAQGIITEGIKPSGKMLEAPPGCPRRFFFSSPPGGRRGQLQKESSQAEKRLKALQAARVAFSSLPRPKSTGERWREKENDAGLERRAKRPTRSRLIRPSSGPRRAGYLARSGG